VRRRARTRRPRPELAKLYTGGPFLRDSPLPRRSERQKVTSRAVDQLLTLDTNPRIFGHRMTQDEPEVSFIQTVVEGLKSLKGSPRLIVVLLLVSLLVAIVPESTVKRLGPTDDVRRFRPLAAKVFIACALWLVIPPVEKRLHTRKLKQRLRVLTEDEKNALRPYIEQQKRVQGFGHLHIAIARSLERAAILSEVPGWNRGPTHFEMDDSAFDFLLKHPELVGIPAAKS
jgi:hypothetical protein